MLIEEEKKEEEVKVVEAPKRTDKPPKIVLSPRFIAAKQRDLAIEVAKKQGGLT